MDDLLRLSIEELKRENLSRLNYSLDY